MRWRLLDAIDELVVGRRARGRVRFDPALPLFEDHFPAFPVVPGVLLLESLAQLSGKLIGYSVRQERGDWPFPVLSMMEGVKFRRFVPPGAELVLHSELREVREEMALCRVRGERDGRVHVNAEQVFVFNAVPLPDPAARQAVERAERAELTRLWSGLPPEDRG